MFTGQKRKRNYRSDRRRQDENRCHMKISGMAASSVTPGTRVFYYRPRIANEGRHDLRVHALQTKVGATFGPQPPPVTAPLERRKPSDTRSEAKQNDFEVSFLLSVPGRKQCLSPRTGSVSRRQSNLFPSFGMRSRRSGRGGPGLRGKAPL